MLRQALRSAVRFFLGLVGLLVAAAARADDWPAARGPSHEPVPYHYDADICKKAPEAFLKESPACLVYRGCSVLVEPDGTNAEIMHEVIRCNSTRGVELLGEYREIVFHPDQHRLTLNVACVHKADGRVVPLQPDHVQLLDPGILWTRDHRGSTKIYRICRQLILFFPDLAPGDVIEVKWTLQWSPPPFGSLLAFAPAALLAALPTLSCDLSALAAAADPVWGCYAFGTDDYPCLRDDLRVRLPSARALTYAARGGSAEPSIQEEADRRLYHWCVTNYRPRKQRLLGDWPRYVAFSTFASWDEVGRWKRELRRDCRDGSPAIRQVVRELTQDLPTPLARVRALTTWVRDHIRYLSAAHIRGYGYQPHTPAQVFADRYGDCKDQCQLLAVMLHEAGIESAFVFLWTHDEPEQVLEAVPLPGSNHVILLVTVDGQEHWIDPTAHGYGWNLPPCDCDCPCYVVDDHGVRCRRTPPCESVDPPSPGEDSSTGRMPPWVLAAGFVLLVGWLVVGLVGRNGAH